MLNKNQPKHKHNQTPHPNHSQPPHTPSTTTKTTSPATTITTNPKINLIAKKKKKNSSWSLVVHYSLGFTAYKAANGGVFLQCGTLSQNRLQVQHLIWGKNGLHINKHVKFFFFWLINAIYSLIMYFMFDKVFYV